MEDRTVRYIVFTIIFVILFFVGVIIYLLSLKFNKKEVVVETTTHNYSYINCTKDTNEEYINRRKHITITYDGNDLSEYKITYTYTTNRDSYVKSLISEVTAIINEEKNNYSSIESTSKNVSGGVEATLTYDLTQSDIRVYINNKYFNKNLYLDHNELINYLNTKNYICE